MTTPIPLPQKFVTALASLTWAEVEYGIRNGWLAEGAAVDLAVQKVSSGDASSDALALASILPRQEGEISPILRRLAEQDAGLTREKWLYLLLAWLYSQRDRVADPLGVVEEIYADFDYPDEIESFVRYMPAQDPSRVGEPYLMEAWRQYLADASRTYGPSMLSTEA